ncbi:MAG: hypothetical protein ACI4SV_03375, partial [Duodenibacillus sp.]
MRQVMPQSRPAHRLSQIAVAAVLLLSGMPAVAETFDSWPDSQDPVSNGAVFLRMSDTELIAYNSDGSEDGLPIWTPQASFDTLINGYSGGYGIRVQFQGSGSWGTYVSYSNDAHMILKGQEAGATTPSFLRIDNLRLPMGTVTVDGTSEAVNSGDAEVLPLLPHRSVLAVKKITNELPVTTLTNEATSDSFRTVYVRSGAVLVLGTHFEGSHPRLDPAIAHLNELPPNLQSLARIQHIAATVGAQSTLVLDNNATAYDGQTRIVVGSVSDGGSGSGIWVGSDGALVVSCGSVSSEDDSPAATRLLRSAGAGLSLHMASDSTFVLYNWDGVEEIYYLPTDMEEGVRIYTVGGVRSQWNGQNFERYNPAVSYGNLRASGLVMRVSDLEGTDMVRMLPGFNFVNDALDATLVSNTSLGEVIDRAAFLPIASGFPAAAETAWRVHAQDLMARPFSLMAEGARFWVMGTTGRLDAPKMFSGPSGTWPIEAEFEYLTAGYDFDAGRGRRVSVSVMGGHTEITHHRHFAATTSDGSLGAVALTALTPITPNTELKGLLLWAQGSGDARMISLGHRLDTDSKLEHYAIAARITSQWDAGV